MYVDDIDHEGLIFWYKDAEDYVKEINKSMGVLS